MLLDEAQKYLEVVRKRGKAKTGLKRVYENICKHKGLFVMAYGRLYANTGALTPGIDAHDTIDGMSLKRIERTIKKLKDETYKWKPTRRTYIPKKQRKKRPLGIPGWEDKLVQEILRMVLEAYYEPQFSEHSHGFRPDKGCHTALSDVYYTWKGVKWFIEGDIKGCFDNIDHGTLLEVMRRQIKDYRLLRLIKGMLNAGYMEDWQYHQTYSGTPQGGVISPLMANILLNEFDEYVEKELIPKHTKGDKSKRKWNPVYQRLNQRAVRAKRRGDVESYKKAIKERRNVPVFKDDGCRWLKYVRYADDFLVGFAGNKEEAGEIKEEIGKYLKSLKLEMSDEKTLITHSGTEKARFLNYHISTMWQNAEIRNCGIGKGRSLNGKIYLTIPEDVLRQHESKVRKKGRVIHLPEWRNNSDYDIIMAYEVKMQGLINYYEMAHDVVVKMGKLRYVYEKSLLKTLASKHKDAVSRIKRRYRRKLDDGRQVIAVEVKREKKKPLVAMYGKQPITQKRNVVIRDEVVGLNTGRNELVNRLLNNTCEICGSHDDVQGHHIRKLADLKKYEGKERPVWVKRMAAMRRKTLFVCKRHHEEIHQGKYDGVKIT
jgi:group II intron reverse transcriptase/maturase